MHSGCFVVSSVAATIPLIVVVDPSAGSTTSDVEEQLLSNGLESSSSERYDGMVYIA